MTDYTKLVRALRYCVKARNCEKCAYRINNNSVKCRVQRVEDAADAIKDMAKHITEMHERVTVLQIARGELERENEKLKDDLEEQKQIAKHYEQSAKDYWKEAYEYKAQLPKRGEWVEDTTTYAGPGLSNYKCSLCGKICGTWRRGLEPSELPNWCVNCGADMRKMEVQE